MNMANLVFGKIILRLPIGIEKRQNRVMPGHNYTSAFLYATKSKMLLRHIIGSV